MELHRRQVLICFCVYLGQILVGYALGWSSSALPKFQNEEQCPLSRPISATEESLIGSLLYLGAVTAPLITNNLTNSLGRKPCFIFCGVFSLCAYIILALTKNLSMVYAGRILAGVSCGILSIVNVVYIGEIASKEVRGIFLSGSGVSTSVGSLIAYSTGPFATYAGTGYIGIGLCGLYLIGLLTIVPETPTFYVIKDDTKKVKEVLAILGRVNDVDEVLASKVEEDIHEWSQLFNIKTNRRSLFVTSTLLVLQQASGIVALLLFTTNIFQIANSSVEPHIATIFVGLTQVIGSVIALFVIERSRRMLLLVSTAVCFICLGVLGAYFYFDYKGYDFLHKLQWLPLATLIMYFLGYSMGFSVIPLTLVGEMFQSNIRSLGSTIAMTCGLLCGFGIATAFSSIITYLGGYVTFWAFSGPCALAFAFTIFCVPETKGKTLLEIQSMLSKRNQSE